MASNQILNVYCRVLFIILLASGCSSKPNVIDSPKMYTGIGSNLVYVVNHGWHTGFVIPSKKTFMVIPELSNRFQDTAYIEFGWGDKGFYQSQEITSGITLQAIFWPTESVVHAVGINQSVEEFFKYSDIELLYLTDEEISLLIKFISASFARNDQNKLIATKLGLYGDSQFYKGIGKYYLMNTCNKWTAKGLKSFGMDISTTFKLTSDSVMDYIRRQHSTE